MKRVRQEAVKRDAVKQEGLKHAPKREKVAQAAAKKRIWWPWVVAIVGLVTVFEAYSPSLNGPFLLDDIYFVFANPLAPTVNFLYWVSNPRPFLMFSYWLNYQQAAAEPYPYHVANVLLHFAGAVVFTWVVLRLLELASVQGLKRTVLAILAGGVFLLHPLQTESVAYVSSRSEVLSVLLYMSAFALFLYRGVERLSLLRAIAILVLFGAAVSTKEHALTLPLLLILADWFWSLGGVRRNAMFYGLLAAGCIPGAWFVWRTLSVASSAGFRVQGLNPEAYFFTQCRVVWIYVKLFFLPFGQNADPDIPLSNGPLEHGAIVGLTGLIALAVAAWIFRKKYPLASFGIFTFLLLLAPTSSFIPIRDVLAERRVYLPFLGLVLIGLEFLRRLTAQHLIWIGVAVLGLCSVLTYRRSALWGEPLELWRDTVEKSPGKWRPRFQLAHAYYSLGQCPKALENFEAASKLGPVDVPLLVDWGLSLDCVGQSNEALVKLRDAVSREPSAHIYSQIGMIYGKARKMPEALAALEQAEKLDAGYDMIYVYRGNIYEVSGDKAAAAEQYRHAQAINPYNQVARDAVVRVGVELMARIGVNALYLIPGGVGGTEIYLRELLKALAEIDSEANQYYIFTNLETGREIVPAQSNFLLKPQAVHAAKRPARVLWEQIVLPLEAARYRLDVLFNPGFTAPYFAPCPEVTVFHDLQHKRHPEHFRWFDLPFWRFLLWMSAHRSRRLIAVSEATRDDLLKTYRLERDRIALVPHGVDEHFFSLDRSAVEPFVLCVSTLHPHKNIERLVRVYARGKRDHRLVLAGMKGFQTQTIEALIADLGIEKNVTITGWIPREELLALYARASAFIYPSTFEGFGMPVLEALAAGIPTACSDIPPLREVAGDAALYFDPSSDADVARGLHLITSDEALRKELSAAGPVRARPFTWRRTAEATLVALLAS